ncbi:MAG: Hsp33 family molecular chaperone HslO [Lachnospiraceae bacterium]|nr:Hsp33 family molecular chaperone HslO [Lachnospiraceae bacterium]
MSDRIIRATAADSMIRAFVADTRELVNTAYTKHHTSPVVTAALGRLLTAGAIMGITQKSESDLLTIKIDGSGPIGHIMVTADYQGRVKGYSAENIVDIPLKPNGKLDVSGALGVGVLTVIKDMGLKEPYVGTTELVSGEIAEDLTYYYMVSEQVPSSIGLGVLVDTDYSVKYAGGFMIQLMPFATDEVIDKLEANLSKVTSVTNLLGEGKSLEDILGILLEGLDPEVVDEVEPSFYCSCSKERVSRALASLGKDELNSMIEDAQPINVHCDFCNSDYEFTPDELKELL